MTEDELRALVTQVVREVVGPTREKPVVREEEPLRKGPHHRPLPAPRSAEALEQLKALTPSRIVTGRTGTRYLTKSYLGLRADHAIEIGRAHV